MNPIPVFRKGAWLFYSVPDEVAAVWSQSLKLQAASVYATFRTQGHSHEASTVFAECFVNKELFGVTYNSQIESLLQGIFV